MCFLVHTGRLPFFHVMYSTVNRDCDFLLGSLLVSTLFSSHDGIIKNLIQSNINNDESVAST